jgi:hypothetical protein
MNTAMITKTSICAAAAAMLSAGAAFAAQPSQPTALAQAPVVLRLSQDEFRIAFGVQAGQSQGRACSGVIRYQVEWKTDDGKLRTETKQVDYALSPRANRTIAVDRAFFDTAEGQHKTDVVQVRVETITCGAQATAL